jgi:hypothetical protein
MKGRNPMKFVAALVAGWFGLAFAAAAAIPNPVVTGPIPSSVVPGDSSRDYTFFASDHPLAVKGYVEEEFFIEGTANRYTTPNLATATIVSSDHPYKTRIVVRRPASSAKFNGVVLVEWFNVTNGFDADNLWFFAWEHVLRSGYAWVGVSAQQVGVNQLKGWSAARYGSLDVTGGGTLPADVLSYDIFSQAGQAIAQPMGVDVLGGLKPRVIIATGESQSAQRLATYINSVMPLDTPVYNGVFLLSNFGQQIRTDVPVPIFKTLFEWDVQSGEGALRQPDSDKYRSWEVAGTAHVDHHLRSSREPLELRDMLVSSEANLAPTCTVPNIGSRVPNHYVVDAAINALVRWVRTGIEPPPSPKMDLATVGPGNAARIARDGFNLAMGGIRLSQIAVPTAQNVGENTGAGACPRWGYHLPFDVATLAMLYPTQRDYVAEVVRVTRENYRHGYILKPDAIATIRQAMETNIGKGARSTFDLESDPDFGE